MIDDEKKNEMFVNIGKNIRYYRECKKLTQEKLAEKVGLSPKHLSRLEAGRHIPYFDTIIMIAKEVDIRIDALLEGVEENHINTFLTMMKSDISTMSTNQLKMLKQCIKMIKEYKF